MVLSSHMTTYRSQDLEMVSEWSYYYSTKHTASTGRRFNSLLKILLSQANPLQQVGVSRKSIYLPQTTSPALGLSISTQPAEAVSLDGEWVVILLLNKWWPPKAKACKSGSHSMLILLDTPLW